MKNKKSLVRFSFIGFLLFFFTIGITSILSIFVFDITNKASGGNKLLVIIFVFLTIIIGAIICTTVDIIRRKNMIEKPVMQILEATKKIASGNFNVKLLHTRSYSKFNEYDLIFDNINTMTAELSKNEVLKNDFIANVSHEIKTPLMIIQNHAKILNSKNISEQTKNESLKEIMAQSSKLASLVSNILKLNKLENQKILPQMEKFNLSELVRLCAINFENLLEKKKLLLDCNIEEVDITSDKTLVEIILNNLLSNAIKFTESGGKITIEVNKSKDFAIIKVSDTGCGISKEIGQHIFDKFYQGDTSHSSEGNGLGLALVKKVIDTLGGEITVNSTVGIGSTFVIKLKKGPY